MIEIFVIGYNLELADLQWTSIKLDPLSVQYLFDHELAADWLAKQCNIVQHELTRHCDVESLRWEARVA